MEIVVNNSEITVEKNSPETVFLHWQTVLNYKRARLDVKRRKLISDRLKDGYSFEDMMDAVNGCYLSPFHQGENQDSKRFDDLGLILRDAAHMDQFIGLYEDAQQRFEAMQRKQNITPTETKLSTAEFAKAALEKMKRMLK